MKLTDKLLMKRWFSTILSLILPLMSATSFAQKLSIDCERNDVKLETGFNCDHPNEFTDTLKSSHQITKIYEKTLLPSFLKDLYFENLQGAAIRYISHVSTVRDLKQNYKSALRDMCDTCDGEVLDRVEKTLLSHPKYLITPVSSDAELAKRMNQTMSTLNEDFRNISLKSLPRLCQDGLIPKRQFGIDFAQGDRAALAVLWHDLELFKKMDLLIPYFYAGLNLKASGIQNLKPFDITGVTEETAKDAKGQIHFKELKTDFKETDAKLGRESIIAIIANHAKEIDRIYKKAIQPAEDQVSFALQEKGAQELIELDEGSASHLMDGPEGTHTTVHSDYRAMECFYKRTRVQSKKFEKQLSENAQAAYVYFGWIPFFKWGRLAAAVGEGGVKAILPLLKDNLVPQLQKLTTRYGVTGVIQLSDLENQVKTKKEVFWSKKWNLDRSASGLQDEMEQFETGSLFSIYGRDFAIVTTAYDNILRHVCAENVENLANLKNRKK